MKVLLQSIYGMKDIADILLLIESGYDNKLFQVINKV